MLSNRIWYPYDKRQFFAFIEIKDLFAWTMDLGILKAILFFFCEEVESIIYFKLTIC